MLYMHGSWLLLLLPRPAVCIEAVRTALDGRLREIQPLCSGVPERKGWATCGV